MTHTMKVILALAAIIIVAGIAYIAQSGFVSAPTVSGTTPTPTPTVTVHTDEHLTIDETLRDVNFCGKTYKVKQIKIDGVDVVQRVAELATADTKVPTFPQYPGTSDICDRIQKIYTEQAELQIVRGEFGHIEGGEYVYYLSISPQYDFGFIVSTTTNSISEEVSGPEYPDPGLFGVFIPIGKLK